MRCARHVYRPAVMLGLLLATSGCAVLGGNIKGNFSCRAPAGDCAPTSVIDGRATEAVRAGTADASLQRPLVTSLPASSLKVVLAAYRDAQGRNHEPRVVEVPLPEPAAAHFQDPATRRDVARALARAVAAARTPERAAPPPAADTTIPAMPDVLIAPLQHEPAGGPGASSLTARVPHPIEGEHEPAPEEGHTP